MRAFITGISGQDGSILASLLLHDGATVAGSYRRTSSTNLWRLRELNVLDKVELFNLDLDNSSDIYRAIEVFKPSHIFHFAAESFVESSFFQPIHYLDINGTGTLRLLEAIKAIDKNIIVYNQVTSEMFGGVSKDVSYTEESIFTPKSPYGISKLTSYYCAVLYRDTYGMKIYNGIVFNHESEYRGLDFVTRKITNAIAKIKLGLSNDITLGNIDTYRDWGYAFDYMLAIIDMIKWAEPSDYIIATNESVSVRFFLEKAFNYVDLDCYNYLKIDEDLFRPQEVMYLKGSYQKLAEKIGWTPSYNIDSLIKIMVDADLRRWMDYLNGVPRIWDALLYDSNININRKENVRKI